MFTYPGSSSWKDADFADVDGAAYIQEVEVDRSEDVVLTDTIFYLMFLLDLGVLFMVVSRVLEHLIVVRKTLTSFSLQLALP